MIPPSGTVTFLFTDVEDSTRMWDRSPIQMRRALERHDEILESVIEENGGYVFTRAGDSFCAAFPRADDAARSAAEIQRRTADEPWEPAVPIAVRIGLHTGEAHERNGDYFGPAVTRAARIESLAHGRQILVSDLTAAILNESTVRVWRLADLGVHRLKGLSDPSASTNSSTPTPPTSSRFARRRPRRRIGTARRRT